MRTTLTNDEFLDELTGLFCREGIKNLTVGEIAARLHCSRRRLYGIAETKEEIFCVAVDHFFRVLLEQGEAIIREEPDPTVAIAAYLNVGIRAGSHMCAQFLKDIEDSEAASASFDAYQQARADGLTRLIDDGVRKGVFVPCHGRVVSELLLGAALRLRRPAFLAQANLTIEEAFRELYRAVLGGLLVKATAPGSTKRGAQAGRGTARTARQGGSAKPLATGDDELHKVLMAAWNRS
ncbi:TetR/AcrR family transcriptional regulator [Cupriavidus sp. NPDC089707]|uniref:TetR/AcrR family transcriptional regulator n=1 Tax=Cupriavidus sp. NPDC089707 TaxID=3363963 RepID=UPI0037FC0B44